MKKMLLMSMSKKLHMGILTRMSLLRKGQFQQKGKYFKNFEYDIKLDANVQPKAHPARQVSFEFSEKLKEKLDEMMEKGIIT